MNLRSRVTCAPVVESKLGGRMYVPLDPARDPTGDDAEDLAVLPSLGALAAPVRVVSD